MPLFNYPYISNMEDHCPNFWGKTTCSFKSSILRISFYAHTPLDVLLVNCKRVTLKVWHLTRFLLANWKKFTIGQARSFRCAQCWNWERFRKQILIKPYIHNTPYGRPKSVKKINHTSNYSIIRVTLNTEFDSLWFSPVFANTINLTPTLCILAKTSVLGG